MSSWRDYLVLSIDASAALYMAYLHWHDCKIVNNIKKAPEVEIGSELVSILNSTPSKSLPYAVIRGCVAEVSETLESSTGMKGVIQISTLHEITTNKFGSSWELEKTPPINETRKVVKFGLRPVLNSPNTPIVVSVENPFESLWENLLIPVSSSFTPSNSAVISSVMGGIGNSKVLGVRKSEKFLPIGTLITGLGQITSGAKGDINIGPCKDNHCPYILTSLSREDIIEKLEFKILLQRVKIGIVLGFGVYLLSTNLYNWWKRYKMSVLRNKLTRERQYVNLDDLCRCQTCMVCLTNPRELIILYCGHVCVCADCCLKLNGSCPVCREPIAATHKAYIV